jgi:hypothetical protein
LESPPHTLDLEDIIPLVKSSRTFEKRSILLSWLAGAPVIGGSDSVESTRSIILEKQQFVLGRCHQDYSLHFA